MSPSLSTEVEAEAGDASCRLRVDVEVLDVNDNAPTFERVSYSVNVPENDPPGRHIIRVTALDPDQRAGGRVTYGLLGPAHFTIDPLTGAVRAGAALDREERALYNL